MFNKELVLKSMEQLREANGAFNAGPGDYNALWLRDQLFAIKPYWYLAMSSNSEIERSEMLEKLKVGVAVGFDFYKKYISKLQAQISAPYEIASGTPHAKVDTLTLNEIVDVWGHHQLDVIGLFLHTVSDLLFKNVQVIRDREDLEVIQLLVYYLRSVEYWNRPDFGIWESCKMRHSYSIGSVIGGLAYVKKQMNGIVLHDSLIQTGWTEFNKMFPNASWDRCCNANHAHCCDASQLFLIWPFNILDHDRQNQIIDRSLRGHQADDGSWHCLNQRLGLIRHPGDHYYACYDNGYTPPVWPMLLFVTSIIYSQRHEYSLAKDWFMRGQRAMINNGVPEIYTGNLPNDHTPLAMGNAFALVAHAKLPREIRQTV